MPATATVSPNRDWGPLVLGGLVALVAIIFLIYPLVNGMLLAFVKNGEEPGWASLTLANFARFFTAASYKRALWNSIYSGLAATLIATALALPMAYAVARIELPLRGLLSAMSVVPLISPPFIGAYAWIILLGKNGTITQFVYQTTGWTLPAIYGPGGVILALALSYFPYVFLIVQGALAAGDPHIEEAARMAGASRWRIIRTVTLPLALPAVAASMLIVFIKVIGDFGVPSILGGEFQVLPTLIYYQIHGFFNLNAASAIAAVNVLLTLLAMLLLGWVNRKRAYASVGGTASAAARFTHPGARLAGNVYCWLVIFVSVLPQLVIALASVAGRWPGTMLPTSYTWAHYQRVGAQLVQPIINSLVLAGIATAICIVFGTLTAYASARGRMRALGAGRHHHAAIRVAWAGDRGRLPDRVQQRAAGADRHRADPGAGLFHAPRGLCVPNRGGSDFADRPQARRCLEDLRRQLAQHDAPGSGAAGGAGCSLGRHPGVLDADRRNQRHRAAVFGQMENHLHRHLRTGTGRPAC